MAMDKKVKIAKDRRIKVCGNPGCLVHKNNRYFEPEDIYCTVCQQELVHACARCGEIFDSKGIDDIICDNCKQIIAEKQAKRRAMLENVGHGAGVAVAVGGKVATVVAGPAGATVGKVAPGVGKIIRKAKPAAAAAAGVAKAIKR